MEYDGGKASSEFVNLPIVQQHIRLSGESAARGVFGGHVEAMNGILGGQWHRFDSPLEVLFWVWWQSIEPVNSTVWEWMELVPQQVVDVNGERFRVDFEIVPTGTLAAEISAGAIAWQRVAVEVDGHGFHERTREQVAYRDRRDRALQAAGWQVFHFSWGEFTSRAEECVGEVFCFMRDRINVARYQAGRQVRAEAAAHNKDAAPVTGDAP